MWNRSLKKLRRLDLRAKITLVILGVLVPTFFLITFAVYQFLQPTLLGEIQRIGISTGSTLANEIVTQHWLSRPHSEAMIENKLREFLYLQPNIRRIEVFARNPVTRMNHLVASTIEEDPSDLGPELPSYDHIFSQLHQELEPSENGWEIFVPIVAVGSKETKAIGLVRVFVSIQLVSRLGTILARVTLIAGLGGMFFLFILLNTALHRTIENDRKLRDAESENQFLSGQLREAERSLMNTEKLAAMGQLTASFAHEIGTPLNAIGGHLSLLKEEIHDSTSNTRLSIIESQLQKISEIVRGFLQSTSKPISQKQLVDPNAVIDKTLGIIRPRMESLHVEIKRDFDRTLGPIRMVPIELEQVMLNLMNNSLDGMRKKTNRSLQLTTTSSRKLGKETLLIRIRDSGEGIAQKDISQVLKPFFTTKPPGEGTGLGLTICQDIAKKYGGSLSLDSIEGQWTEVCIELPYGQA